MNKRFLITMPSSDDAEHYLYEWSREIKDKAVEKGLEIKALEREKANRKEFEGHIKRMKPDFVMLNGHGDTKTIYGNNQEVILLEGDNHQLLQGAIVYARSCFSLSSLGKAAVLQKCTAFVGYTLPFMFMSDTNSAAHPLKDEFAAPCLYTSNMVPIALIKGNTIEEAVNKSKDKMHELMLEWETRVEMEASWVAGCLSWNKNCLGYEGEGRAKL